MELRSGTTVVVAALVLVILSCYYVGRHGDTADADADALPWFEFNSSDAATAVPYDLSWMLDADEMVARGRDAQFDMDVARRLSQVVSATYCTPENLVNWNCSRCLDDLERVTLIEDPSWDLLGVVGWSEALDGVVVSFRGTDSHSYYNWVENMRTWRTDLSLSYEGMPPEALVHGGFFYSYNDSSLAGGVSEAVRGIVEWRAEMGGGERGGGRGAGFGVLEAMTGGLWSGLWSGTIGGGSERDAAEKVTPTVFVSGHSLGGALATFCALEMKLVEGIDDVRVVTFGSPRVGNAVFAAWFKDTVPQHVRFTHNRDMIPSLPPMYMGFSHIPHEVWLVDVVPSRTLVGVCDGSGEDVRCHRGACSVFGFGSICVSLADHLGYLSPMYMPRGDADEPAGC